MTMSKKKKLRRLTIKVKNSKLNKLKNIIITVIIGVITAFLLICCSPTIIDDFMRHYNQHYNLIVHGNSDYCNEKILNAEIMFNEIRKDIFNQNDAIIELESLFKNHSEILTSIGIIGSSGIGKTVLATKILYSFPWSDNIHYFKWSVFEDDQFKIRKLLRYINRLSNCGQNLLIIDDLTLDNLETVLKFNEIILKKLLSINIKRLILIYIVNVSRFTVVKDENYEDNLIYIKDKFGSKIKTVIFRKFNKSDLDYCIENEIKQLNITLTDDEFNNIRNSVDVIRSGCKNVYAKIKLFM